MFAIEDVRKLDTGWVTLTASNVDQLQEVQEGSARATAFLLLLASPDLPHNLQMLVKRITRKRNGQWGWCLLDSMEYLGEWKDRWWLAERKTP